MLQPQGADNHLGAHTGHTLAGPLPLPTIQPLQPIHDPNVGMSILQALSAAPTAGVTIHVHVPHSVGMHMNCAVPSPSMECYSNVTAPGSESNSMVAGASGQGLGLVQPHAASTIPPHQFVHASPQMQQQPIPHAHRQGQSLDAATPAANGLPLAVTTHTHTCHEGFNGPYPSAQTPMATNPMLVTPGTWHTGDGDVSCKRQR